jgi:TRAP-type C4-dicarboxylate transport system permease small subunit
VKRLFLRVFGLADDALYYAELAAVSLGLLLMVGLYFTQVLMRNLGEGGVPWFQTVVQHLVLWVGMIGASLCVRDRKHIAIEVLAKTVSPSGRRVVEGLVDVSTGVLCVVLAMIAWGYIDYHEVPEDKVLAVVGGFEVKRWWSLLAIPLGFGAMAFRYAHLTAERIFVDEAVDKRAEIAAEMRDYERRYSSGELAAYTGSGAHARPGEAAPDEDNGDGDRGSDSDDPDRGRGASA